MRAVFSVLFRLSLQPPQVESKTVPYGSDEGRSILKNICSHLNFLIHQLYNC